MRQLSQRDDFGRCQISLPGDLQLPTLVLLAWRMGTGNVRGAVCPPGRGRERASGNEMLPETTTGEERGRKGEYLDRWHGWWSDFYCCWNEGTSNDLTLVYVL